MERDCYLWKPDRKKDECDNCVDGRDIELVSEYASTCDGDCNELTSHEEMIMDEKTQLGYCEKCAKKMGLVDKTSIFGEI
jgi:hypothetical protein